MALIKCSKCKKKVSENANICPNCGFELKKEKRKLFKNKIYNNINKYLNKIPKKIFLIISIFILSIIFGLVLSIIIKLFRSDIYHEKYYYSDDDILYTLVIQKNNKCEYEDSLRGKLNCNYEVVTYDKDEILEFKLIVSLKDDEEIYTYYNCIRQVDKESEIKGKYNLIRCENNNLNMDEILLFSTRGSKE